MKTIILGGLLVLGAALGGGCSSDNAAGTADPTALCKQLANAICSKLYGCYSPEQLGTMTEVAADSEAGCVTKWTTDLECGDPQVCDPGQSYDAAKGNQCVNDYKSFSCADFQGYLSGTKPSPAACNETCK